MAVAGSLGPRGCAEAATQDGQRAQTVARDPARSGGAGGMSGEGESPSCPSKGQQIKIVVITFHPLLSPTPLYASRRKPAGAVRELSRNGGTVPRCPNQLLKLRSFT
jgi:hypothetical protein